MFKHFTILNLFIAAGVLILLASLFEHYSSLDDVHIEEAYLAREGNEESEKRERGNRSAMTVRLEDSSAFSVISDRNLFHPERRIVDDQKRDGGQAERVKPDLILYGTVVSEGGNSAYVEDRRDPYSTPGRGRRQKVLRLGTVIAGYEVTEIEETFVVLTSNGDRITLRIEDHGDLKHKMRPHLTEKTSAEQESAERRFSERRKRSEPHRGTADRAVKR